MEQATGLRFGSLLQRCPYFAGSVSQAGTTIPCKGFGPVTSVNAQLLPLLRIGQDIFERPPILFDRTGRHEDAGLAMTYHLRPRCKGGRQRRGLLRRGFEVDQSESFDAVRSWLSRHTE